MLLVNGIHCVENNSIKYKLSNHLMNIRVRLTITKSLYTCSNRRGVIGVTLEELNFQGIKTQEILNFVQVIRCFEEDKFKMFTCANSAKSSIRQTFIVIILWGLYCFVLCVFLNHRVLQSHNWCHGHK